MKHRMILAALLTVCGLTAPVVAQKSQLKDGDYVCRNQGKITGSFAITGPGTYRDADGGQHAYQYDAGLNVLNFDNGKQYFIGRADLLILVVNGQISKHGCIRQIR